MNKRMLVTLLGTLLLAWQAKAQPDDWGSNPANPRVFCDAQFDGMIKAAQHRYDRRLNYIATQTAILENETIPFLENQRDRQIGAARKVFNDALVEPRQQRDNRLRLASNELALGYVDQDQYDERYRRAYDLYDEAYTAAELPFNREYNAAWDFYEASIADYRKRIANLKKKADRDLAEERAAAKAVWDQCYQDAGFTPL